MIKLKKIITERGLDTSTGEAPKDGNHGNTTKFSTDAKRHFLEIVSTYNKYQEMMDRKSDIVQVAETLGGIIEAAKQLAVNEGDDWFDKHTVKRNMNELSKLGSQFDKVTKEAKLLDQRMSGLYEDMGHILSRYYKIGEITEDEMKSRLGMRNEGKINEEIYWVNSNNKVELGKFYDEVKSFMPDHSIQKLSPLSIQFDISRKDLNDVIKMSKSYKGLKVVKESITEDKAGYAVSDFGDLKDNDLIKVAILFGKKSKSFIKNLLKQLHRDKTISTQLQSEGIVNEDKAGYAVSDFGDLKDNDLIKAIVFASKKSKSFIKNLVNNLKKEKLIGESLNEYDEWKNTRIQAKNIFRMLKQKHNNNISDMKQGLVDVIKQNKTKPDQEKVMWDEFNKYFNVKEIKESFTPSDIAMIKKVVDKEKRLIGLSPIFKKMGWHTDFVMMDSVPPHLKLKKKKNDKQTYLLVNKRYVDKPDWVSGEIAGGLDENKKSNCDTCDKK